MKTSRMRTMTSTRLFSHPFLTGMGSTVDLFGFTFEKVNLDLSTGFQRDAKSIWNDFLFIGMDIQESMAVSQAPMPAAEK